VRWRRRREEEEEEEEEKKQHQAVLSLHFPNFFCQSPFLNIILGSKSTIILGGFSTKNCVKECVFFLHESSYPSKFRAE
jgi:hypothetical protein